MSIRRRELSSLSSFPYSSSPAQRRASAYALCETAS